MAELTATPHLDDLFRPLDPTVAGILRALREARLTKQDKELVHSVLERTPTYEVVG